MRSHLFFFFGGGGTDSSLHLCLVTYVVAGLCVGLCALPVFTVFLSLTINMNINAVSMIMK